VSFYAFFKGWLIPSPPPKKINITFFILKSIFELYQTIWAVSLSTKNLSANSSAYVFKINKLADSYINNCLNKDYTT